MVFKFRAALGEQSVCENFAGPFDRQIRREDPHIRRGPQWAVLLGGFISVLAFLALTAYAVASGVGMSSRATVRFPSPQAGSESET